MSLALGKTILLACKSWVLCCVRASLVGGAYGSHDGRESFVGHQPLSTILLLHLSYNLLTEHFIVILPGWETGQLDHLHRPKLSELILQLSLRLFIVRKDPNWFERLLLKKFTEVELVIIAVILHGEVSKASLGTAAVCQQVDFEGHIPDREREEEVNC